jgi:6-phosphofructokinase 1
MDNDVPGTDYCIGFETAVNRATEYIDRMRSTAASHGETVLFRLFGRDAGFTAIETAIAAWADRVLIPEVQADRYNKPSSYSVVVVSEGANLGRPVAEVGAPDPYGHRKKSNVAEFLAVELGERLPGVRFLPIDLTYILRSGEPDVYDRRTAVFFANLAMSLVEEGVAGVMTAYRNGRVAYTELPGKNHPARRVDPTEYNQARYRPNFEGIRGSFYPSVSQLYQDASLDTLSA